MLQKFRDAVLVSENCNPNILLSRIYHEWLACASDPAPVYAYMAANYTSEYPIYKKRAEEESNFARCWD